MVQDDRLYQAYIAICNELAITPASAAGFASTATSPPDARQIINVGDAASTWVLLRDDRRDGCATCIHSIGPWIEHFYGGHAATVFSPRDAEALLGAFDRLHDLSLALTNAYAPQNWSCVLPVAGCVDCADVLRASCPPTARAAEVVEGHDVDTAGRRTSSATGFVAANRWAFGFAAVVGNPVPVPDVPGVTLVNAPIRTSVDPSQCEIAGGKGVAAEQALASCLGEALERYALASTVHSGSVTGAMHEVPDAVDVATEFGFPVVDGHPSIRPCTPSARLEWVGAVELLDGTAVRLPANFAYCPYVAPDDVDTIVAGSTNGAASGATRGDARSQAMRETVERDAFWFYARTGVSPIHVEPASLPTDLVAAMDAYNGTFAVTLLVNPFQAPVANVTFTSGASWATRSARGSGHSTTVLASIRRAFAECVQMLQSLDSGIEVSPNPSDMRHLWFSGEAIDAMPNLFEASNGRRLLDESRQLFVEGQSTHDLVVAAARQGQRAFEIPIARENSFAVVKVLLTGASVADPTYFSNSRRLETFAANLELPPPSVTYSGSLFM